MSTAVLISGQLRTFAKCWPTQRWHVLRHFDDPHFFITVQDEMEGVEPFELGLLRAEYGSDHVHVDLRTDPDLSAHLTPELAAAFHLAPYANAAPAHQLLLQHWYQAEVWKHFCNLKSQISDLKSPVFDTVIRLRGDLWFHSFEISDLESQMHERTALVPWWGRFGGINDRLAVMGPEAAKYYFTVFEAIPELLAAGCPFHPESLVKANLERGNINLYETLRTEFSTLRQNGQSRPPEIAPWDLAHAALRAS
jgi:hypothetical protein